MIYRIVIVLYPDPDDEEDLPEHARKPSIANIGCFLEPIDLMEGLGLPGPPREFDGTESRFYFTEFGWEQIGRHVATELEKIYQIRVQRRRNPTKNNVVYHDRYQVAISVRNRSS